MAEPVSTRIDSGFTLVEVLAAGAVLSVIALCLVRAWTVFDVMSLDLQVRQKAVFVLNGETERLSALYSVGGFGGAGPAQLQSVSGSAYPAIGGIAGSAKRLVYGSATTSATPFTTTSYRSFIAPTSSDFRVLISGAGTSTQNFVWLDRGRSILGRLSWVACPIADPAGGSTTSASCWGSGTSMAGTKCFAYTGLAKSDSINSGGASCYLITLVLDYPFRALGSAPVDETGLAGTHLPSSTITLSTVVGRWI